MRPLSALLILALAAQPAAAAGVSKANRLVRLSGMIKTSLGTVPVVPTLGGKTLVSPVSAPGGSPLLYPQEHGGGPVPAVWDPAKAAVLLELAEARQGGLAAPVAEQTVPPAKLLEALNSVLKDLPAEELKKLPPEQLDAVLDLVFDRLEPGRSEAAPEAVVALSQARFENLKSMQDRPLKESLLRKGQGINEPDHLIVRGVPKGVKALPPSSDGRETGTLAADSVFRYYVTKEGLEGILSSGGIWNGLRPLMTNFGEGFQKYYPDLTGIFLTSPQTPGLVAGLPAKEFPAFVDVKLPKGVPILDAMPEFPGTFFLVPLPARTQGWIRDSYLRWLTGEPVAPYYEDTIRSLDKEGGPGPELTLPVEIIGHGLIAPDGSASYFPAKKSASGAVIPAPEALTSGLSRRAVSGARSSKALLAALRKNAFLDEQYDQLVVKERYTLEQHTLMVLEQFEKYSKLPLPPGIDRAFFRVIIALHDVGKPAAIAEGDPKRQHAHTVKIMKVLLPRLGYGAADVAKATALVSADLVGAFVRGGDAADAEKAIRAAAEEAGMPASEFFTALLTLYKVDAGSYTEDAGGQHSLDELFDFDPKSKTIRTRSNEVRLADLAARLGP